MREVFSQLHSQSIRCLEGDRLTHPPLYLSLPLSVHPSSSLSLSIHPIPLSVHPFLPLSLISHSFLRSDSNNYSETFNPFSRGQNIQKTTPKVGSFPKGRSFSGIFFSSQNKRLCLEFEDMGLCTSPARLNARVGRGESFPNLVAVSRSLSILSQSQPRLQRVPYSHSSFGQMCWSRWALSCFPRRLPQSLKCRGSRFSQRSSDSMLLRVSISRLSRQPQRGLATSF